MVPSLLYGLKVLELTGKVIKVLGQYQRKSLKQIQSPPDKAHSSAVLALLGILPLKSVIHKNMLNIFVRWIASDGIERDIAERQLATKSVSVLSWFNRIKRLLEFYKLPAASYLMVNVASRSNWKKMVNKVRKTAKIRNKYNQVPHLTQDTTWESDKITIRHHKQEPRRQPFPRRAFQA